MVETLYLPGEDSVCKVDISLATLLDLNDIVNVERECFSSAWPKDVFQKELQEVPWSRIYLAKVNKQVVGYFTIWKIEDEYQLQKIAVLKAYQRNQIASQMILFLDDLQQKEYVRTCFLELRESNVAAYRLYLKHGFEQIGKRRKYYSDTKEDALLMVKTYDVD